MACRRMLKRHFSKGPPKPLSVSLRNLKDPSSQHTHVDASAADICRALAGSPSHRLDSLRVDPSPPLVAAVLKRLSNSGPLAPSFFSWAQAQQGFQHSAEAYHAVIESLGKSRQFRKVWELVDLMKSRHILTRDTFSLVSRRYARAKMPDEAVKTFHRMDSHFGFPLGLSDYNRLLDVLCKSGYVVRAQKVFDEMRQRSLAPDVKSYTIMLEGWSGQGPNLARIREVWREMRDGGLEPDVVAHGIVINAHCKARRPNEAVEIFRAMEARGIGPTPHIFCTLVIGLGSAGRLGEALEFFRRSKESGFPPEAPTYNAAVSAYCWAGRTSEALALAGEMRALGIGPGPRTYEIIIRRLVKARKRDEAVEVFEAMACEPGPGTYEIMARMFLGEGNAELAIRVWDRMRGGGVVPGMHVYAEMIGGLRRAGRLDEACRYTEEMLGLGIRPPARLFGDLKKALLDNGRTDILEALNQRIQRLRETPLD